MWRNQIGSFRWYWHPNSNLSSPLLPCMSAALQNLKAPETANLHLWVFTSSSGKGSRGAKTGRSCQPAQKWYASGGVLWMEMLGSNNHRRSLVSIGEEEFDSYGPVLLSFKHLLWACGKTTGQQGHPSSHSPMRSLGWWKASLMYNFNIRRRDKARFFLLQYKKNGVNFELSKVHAKC